MIIDILNFMVAVATVFLAYRFFIERSKREKDSRNESTDV